MSKQPEALRLADESDNDEWIAGTNQWREEASKELRRLHEVNQELLEALNRIQHSVKQAQISGNDWRRELVLIQNITRSTIAKAAGDEK